MEEHLVGYLLGSLDPVTHARVEVYLRSHPEAEERLDRIRTVLAPLAEDAEDPEPPPGLMLSTLARIAEYRCKLPTAPKATSTPMDAPPVRFFRRIDWIVAACLFLTVGGFGVPYLVRQWHEQQRLACGNNLRKFWVALTTYSDQHEGNFPRVEAQGARGVAGIFVPMLRDNGLARDVSLACPTQGRQDPLPLTVADLEQLHRDSPDEFHRISSLLSGHYAYSLGYLDGSTLRGLRRDSADGLPILADRSNDHGTNSPNHHGRGQNVLYVGGHVRWAVQPTVGEDADHIYINHLNRIGAGLCRSDSVLGSSEARPNFGR